MVIDSESTGFETHQLNPEQTEQILCLTIVNEKNDLRCWLIVASVRFVRNCTCETRFADAAEDNHDECMHGVRHTTLPVTDNNDFDSVLERFRTSTEFNLRHICGRPLHL
jgi:hypothetical protein